MHSAGLGHGYGKHKGTMTETGMRVSDYVVRFLEAHDIHDVFLVSGGGIMYLLDSLVTQDAVRYYCSRHEQACAISAEGYARATGKPGVCLATTGPGATNAAAGILGAWADSLPLLVISGQVKRELMADFSCLRQKGPQEGNILDTVAPVTKHVTSVKQSGDVRREFEHAWHAATSGRPGPVWVEIPLDVQAERVDAATLPGWQPHAAAQRAVDPAEPAIAEAADALAGSRRPLVVGGAGVRIAGAAGPFRRFCETYGLPVVVPDSGKDLLPEDHPLNMGVFGPAAQRRANFAVQNADCLLVLGASLCAKKIGFAYDDFARLATKIVVDIDPDQLEHQVVRPDIAVCDGVQHTLERLGDLLAKRPPQIDGRWLAACAEWRRLYPPVLPENLEPAPFVDAYGFMDALSEGMSASDLMVTGNGLDSVAFVQAFRVKERQRAFLNSNWGAMGWDVPLAVGASVGSPGLRTVCVTGDGSIQMNLQELLTLSHYRLPVTVFVFNNEGYATIRATQRNLFDGRIVASGVETGVDNPDFEKLADAFGLGYSRIATNDDIRARVAEALARPCPHLCEVMISPDQEIKPRSAASRLPNGTLVSRPLEDMTPLLPRDELERNMHLFDEESQLT